MKPRLFLIAAALLFTVLFIAIPVATVFAQALAKGWQTYVTNLSNKDTLHAVWLTIATTAVVVPLNLVFGIAAAWAITRFDFGSKKWLIATIELPFSVSPIVAGVAYILLYGGQGLIGPWLDIIGIRIMFAWPAIVLVTLFVTSPFIARELIPLMQAQGRDREEAAATLGADGWRIFMKVTLPNIRWALLYGAILTTARAIGEFGAVSVVSGNIRGVTNTLPLQVELLYHDYNAAGAFAAASTLTVIALLTLVLRAVLERRAHAALTSTPSQSQNTQ